MIEEKSRKIKQYNDHLFNVKIKGLEKEIEVFKEMKRLIKVIDKDAETVEELESILNTRSGFVNTSLSFTAYGLETEYKDIKRLEESCTNIKEEYLNKDFTLKKVFINQLRDEYITYFSDAELKAREVLESLMKQYNELAPAYRYLIGYNRKYDLAYTNQGEYKVNKSAEKILEKELINQ